MRKRIFTVRWAASLAGCAVLFGILWLGVGLGCDQERKCQDREPTVWHFEWWSAR